MPLSALNFVIVFKEQSFRTFSLFFLVVCLSLFPSFLPLYLFSLNWFDVAVFLSHIHIFIFLIRRKKSIYQSYKRNHDLIVIVDRGQIWVRARSWPRTFNLSPPSALVTTGLVLLSYRHSADTYSTCTVRASRDNLAPDTSGQIWFLR